MDRIEFEMPDEYKRNLEILMDLLKDRDEYQELLPTLAPDVRAEAMPAFQELCAACDDLEQKLADEYERYQNEQNEFARRRAERKHKHLTWAAKTLLHLQRTKSPEAARAFELAMIEDKTPEEEKEFYFYVKMQEAEELSEKRYIIIKHTKPHLFEEFHQISVDSLTPEELQEFLDRIAHLEATQLEDILAGK